MTAHNAKLWDTMSQRQRFFRENFEAGCDRLGSGGGTRRAVQREGKEAPIVR